MRAAHPGIAGCRLAAPCRPSTAQSAPRPTGRIGRLLCGPAPAGLPPYRRILHALDLRADDVLLEIGPVTVSAGPVVDPGQRVTVIATVHNPGDASLRDVRLSLRTPAGWTSAPHAAARGARWRPEGRLIPHLCTGCQPG